MNQLDELMREHSDSVPADDLIERRALEYARTVLRSAAVHEHPGAARRRHKRRRVPRLVLIGALAAVTAVVVAFIPGGTGNEIGRLGPATASAKAFLDQAAHAIVRHGSQPLGAGEYYYAREVSSNPGHNGLASPRPNFIQDTWIGAHGFARLVQTGPTTVIPGGDVLLFHASPQQLQAERQRQRHGAHLRILAYSQQYRWVDLDYQQLIRLPTDPTKLQRFIERHATGGGPRFADIFTYAAALLGGMGTGGAPLPPKVSAAMYRVIARLPGMRLIGPTRDPLGRPGVAVGLFFKGQVARIELIFNPSSGVLLAERGISLNAKAGAPAGTVMEWGAIEHQGVVHSDHR